MILVLVPFWLGIASAEPCAAVHVAAVGFAEEMEQKLTTRAAAEIRARGVSVCVDAPLAPTAECLAQVPCARDIVRGANAQFLVAVDALRAGAAVQLTAQLFLADGRRELDVDVARSADQLGAGGPVIPDEILAALVRARDALPPPSTAQPSEPPPVQAPAPLERTAETPPEASAGGDAIPPLAIAGVVVTSAGALLAVVGAATAVGQLGVIRDAGSTGADKERAAVLVPVMASVGLVGLVAAGAGAVLLGLGLSSASETDG